MNILFIGLGNMGAPMAAHLASAGHSLTVANRSPAKITQWLASNQGQVLAAPSPLPSQTDAVILCVSRDEDVEEWLIDNGIINQLKPGALIVDHSTRSAGLAERMAAKASENGVYFCDVPVSGGQQGAQNGQLSLMAGCDSNAYERLVDLTAPYTKAIAHMGEPGCGQKTKMVNQICVAGLIQSLAEGIHFAQESGLDPKKVMELVGQGAASSWQLINRHQTMIDGDYDHGFAVSLMHKDLQICLHEAKAEGVSLPITEIVDSYYQQLESGGNGNKDTSSLLLRLQQRE